jgi:hypothetical protein
MSHEIADWERWRTTTSTSPYTRRQWHETSAYKISTSKQFLNNPSTRSKNYQLQTSSIQDYIQAIDNEFEAYHSQLKANVEFQKEFQKYDNLLDRLLVEKNQSP